MAKTKFVSPQQYAANLGAVIQATEDAGNKVAPFFEKLDDAIKADKVAEMPKAEFQEIAMEFDEALPFTRMLQLRSTQSLPQFV